MKETNKIKLQELLEQFNSMYSDAEMVHFHSQWQLYLTTLSKKERVICTKTLLEQIYQNSKTLCQGLLDFAQQGEQERQSAISMVNELANHPAFAAKRLPAN
jgi:hypothetical protein